jgi:hypothetical protein
VQKAPFQIPQGAREWIVKYGPWITVVLLVLSLPPLLVVPGVGTALVPFGGVGYAAGCGYMTVVLIIQPGPRCPACSRARWLWEPDGLRRGGRRRPQGLIAGVQLTWRAEGERRPL